MKKYIILILVTSIFLNCSPNDVEITEGYNFDGMGGIKCKVDGILLEPHFELYGNSRARADSYSDGTPFFFISFHNTKNPDLGFQYIRLLLVDADSRNSLNGRVFNLKNEKDGQSYGEYGSVEFGDGATNTNYTGKLEILYHNVQERIIGGKFWFDAVNSNDEIREIRNGEFDMKYY